MTDLEKRVRAASVALYGEPGVEFGTRNAEIALRAAFPELFTEPPRMELTYAVSGTEEDSGAELRRIIEWLRPKAAWTENEAVKLIIENIIHGLTVGDHLKPRGPSAP